MAFEKLRKNHPFKFLWALSSILFTTLKLPLYILIFLLPRNRPDPKWTFRQSLSIHFLRLFLKIVSEVEMKTPESLDAGKEGDRFVIMDPSSLTSKYYVGVTAVDKEIQPRSIGGTWYSSLFTVEGGKGKGEEKVVLHFHGGAYAVGDGRIRDCGFLSKTLLEETDATHIFCPQYRLASNPLGRFPAQLQDAITSLLYLHLTMKIPAKDIVLSGDSAGGNICLALLRYISDHPEAGLPQPACAFLWSPWISPPGALEVATFRKNKNYKTDYLPSLFGSWGALALAPHPSTGLSLGSPYIDFLGSGKGFESQTPMWWSVGSCEMLEGEILEGYKLFEGVEGNKMGLGVEEGAVHDVALVGDKLGFRGHARRGARRAGEFWRGLEGKGVR